MEPYFRKHIENFVNVIRIPQKMHFEKNKIVKNYWEADHNFSCGQNKVVDRESRLIPTKIKETVHSLRNLNDINNFFCVLNEIWLHNLRYFLVN